METGGFLGLAGIPVFTTQRDLLLVKVLASKNIRSFTLSTLTCLLLSSCLVQVLAVMLVRLYACIFWHYQETQSHSSFTDPLVLTIFLSPLHHQSLSLGSKSFVIDESVVTGLHNSTLWWWWFSVMVSPSHTLPPNTHTHTHTTTHF